MNIQEAKEILSLYRPGTADAGDSSFRPALELCERDADLKRWFDDHCSIYAALRSRFKQIAVPEGLKEQILSERKVRKMPLWRRPLAIAAMVGLVMLLSVAVFWMLPRQPGFADYRARMAGVALRTYAMNLKTANLEQIRNYFTKTAAPSDYRLPKGTENATTVGCANLTWNNHPVSMICFKSGKPLPPGQMNDLWLFVVNEGSMPHPPAEGGVIFAKVNRLSTASWTRGGETYILAADGDEAFLRKYL